MRATMAAVLAVVVWGAVSPAAAAPAADPTTGDGSEPRPPAATSAVGLITGDTVTVSTFPDGERGIEVELAERGGGETVGHEIVDQDGQTYVIPSDVAPLLPDRLDPELFNVTKLLDYGYDREHGLPVIAASRAPGQAEVSSLAATPGIRDRAALPAIDGEAVTVDSRGPAFWRAVSERRAEPATGERVTGLRDPLPPAGKIWLDERIEVALDESVPAVGAPAAWAAGYDGTGVTVAVLDTGIDADHPDFAGRIAGTQTFLSAGTAADGHGHGTHVAGIVAGDGSASGGTYSGVAPGAELLVGKVLGDDGTGLTSDIIQGMEWAAQSDADVVNMSLGSASPSNGLDPLSRAADQLTEAHGTLFVAAAGNQGPGGWTIGSPGAASAALTVGAVDGAGELARFSSRGPRLVPELRHLIGGEFAIKPDLTAPGVGIASARGTGTTMGTPVDARHTRASGTSMAAPHVAGAAAIVAQQRPELDPVQLKSTLVTTAAPAGDQTIYQQGGGLLDLAAAVEAPLATSVAPLDFGSFTHPYPQHDPISTGVTYTNLHDQQLSLDLALELTSPEAGPPGEAVVQVTPERLDLAPGESAEVTVTLDPGAGEPGTYGGYLAATGAGDTVVSRVPTGFWLEPPTRTLTIEGIGRDGEPADGPLNRVDIVDVHDLNTLSTDRSFYGSGGTITLEVPQGTYSVVGRFQDPHPEYGEEVSLVALPEVAVTEDLTLVLDARTANEVTVDTPGYETSRLPFSEVLVGYQRETGAGQHFARVYSAEATAPIHLAQADAPITGGFSAFSRQLLTNRDRSVLYDAVLVEPDGIPEDPHHVLDRERLAGVTNRYHSDRPDQVVGSTRFVELPGWEGWELSLAHQFNVPVERTDYYVAGQGGYRERVYLNGSSRPSLFTPLRTYDPGQRLTHHWFARPSAPGLRPGEPAYRAWDRLHLDVSPWVDQGGNALEGPVDYAFFADGEPVSTGTDPQTLPLSPEPGEYRLELHASADRSWWQTSTAASTAWTWRSQRPAGAGPENAPLVLLDYDLPIDLSNTLARPERPGGGPVAIGLRASHQPGTGDVPIAGARLSISYDDGETWRRLPARGYGDGRYEFLLDRRHYAGRGGFASLRAEAWDAAGGRIEQEVIRAFALPDRTDPEPPPGTTERVSVASDGTQANGGSQAPATISADGRFVAFTAYATNLDPAGRDLSRGAFVHDRQTGETERVSVASDGTPAIGSAPKLSADGRFVAFASTSPDLVADKTSSHWDIFVHDRQTGETTRVSVASDGTEPDAGATASGLDISGDGRFVTFQSNATNLVPGDTNGGADVFVHDRQTGETERVSVASDGTETPRYSSSSRPAISGDGRYVTFSSSGSNLVPGDTNNLGDVFVHDRETGQTERVSVTSDQDEASSSSSNPDISADGRYVTFTSFASDLVPGDTNRATDVFIHDRQSGTTERVSMAGDGTESDGTAYSPTISADGQYVGFASRATNLVPGDTNAQTDLFIVDRETGGVARVSVARDGTEANAGARTSFSISADGRVAAFTSDASNLVPGDTNGEGDVFVRDPGQPR